MRELKVAPPSIVHSVPFTLHSTPCTLHPAPYTLHPAPYTRHPTPFTLRPAPYTLRCRAPIGLAWFTRLSRTCSWIVVVQFKAFEKGDLLPL